MTAAAQKGPVVVRIQDLPEVKKLLGDLAGGLESARRIAVVLEQENAALVGGLRSVIDDLEHAGQLATAQRLTNILSAAVRP